MKSSSFAAMLLGVAFSSASALAAPVPSLCNLSEKVVFSCAIAHSSKLASVCRDNDRLTYRFGKPEKIELSFPAAPAPAKDNFTFDRSGPPNARVTSLGFNNQVDYTIVETTTDAGASAKIVLQAAHSLALGFLEKTLDCKKGYLFSSEELEKMLAASH